MDNCGNCNLIHTDSFPQFFQTWVRKIDQIFGFCWTCFQKNISEGILFKMWETRTFFSNYLHVEGSTGHKDFVKELKQKVKPALT